MIGALREALELSKPDCKVSKHLFCQICTPCIKHRFALENIASLRTLENEGGEAPVEAGEVCPACMGKKMIRTGYKIMSDCEKCDGTGQATPEAKEGRGEA